MKYSMIGLALIFLTISALTKPLSLLKNNTVLSTEEIRKIISCKPLTLSESGPLPTVSEMPRKIGHELTITFGPYKFVRSDVGDPDGELKIYNKSKLICDVETSILTGIKLVPKSNLILLKWSSGSSNTWEIFQTEGKCKSLGVIPDKHSSSFESILSQLKPCQD